MEKFSQKYKVFLAPTISGVFIVLGFILQKFNIPFSPIVFIGAFIIGGYKQAKEGIEELFGEHKFNVEFLMIFAAIGASIIGFWQEGAMLIFIFALSGALEEYATDKSKKAIHQLMDLQPLTAKRLTKQHEVEEVALDFLQIGDTLRVLKGEIIPIDGKITKGISSFNEAAITGEPLPKEKSVADEIFGGTINVSQPIEMKVTKNIDETLIRLIVKMVDEAQNNPSKSAQFIDRIEDTYVKAVLIIVFFMLFLPHFLLGWAWSETIYRAMVLLVVSSPCALVASITPATLSAISNGAKNGILVKGGIHLENLYNVKAVCFDKTGTLTYGAPKITDFVTIEKQDKRQIIEAVVSIETFSTHPLATAIVTEGAQLSSFKRTTTTTHIEDVAGKGIIGVCFDSHWIVGKKDFVKYQTANEELKQQARKMADEGKTIVFIQRDTEVVGFIALQDIVRKEAKAVIHALNEQGIQTILITGDNEHTAKAIADSLDIKELSANCLPDEKVTKVKAIQDKFGIIAMVGDGINDAPALATANIGVAMGKGSDIAMESADIILMESDISKLYYALKLSQKLHTISIQNVIFSLIVIGTLIFSNFFQAITLPLGVIGHEGSTILVILNGLRLLYFKNKTM